MEYFQFFLQLKSQQFVPKIDMVGRIEADFQQVSRSNFLT